MNRSDVTELHYITPITNLPSIMRLGILSNKRASRISHVSIAMEEVQDLRSQKQIPGAGRLHDYVNLYFDAHNPMLSKRRERNYEICVLRVSSGVLDVSGIIISDRNAASSYAKFLAKDEGIASLDKDSVFARYWTHDNPFEQMEHASIKCAEVLVPDRVPPELITGVYVANEAAKQTFLLLNIPLSVTINGGIFF